MTFASCPHGITKGCGVRGWVLPHVDEYFAGGSGCGRTDGREAVHPALAHERQTQAPHRWVSENKFDVADAARFQAQLIPPRSKVGAHFAAAGNDVFVSRLPRGAARR